MQVSHQTRCEIIAAAPRVAAVLESSMVWVAAIALAFVLALSVLEAVLLRDSPKPFGVSPAGIVVPLLKAGPHRHNSKGYPDER